MVSDRMRCWGMTLEWRWWCHSRPRACNIPSQWLDTAAPLRPPQPALNQSSVMWSWRLARAKLKGKKKKAETGTKWRASNIYVDNGGFWKYRRNNQRTLNGRRGRLLLSLRLFGRRILDLGNIKDETISWSLLDWNSLSEHCKAPARAKWSHTRASEATVTHTVCIHLDGLILQTCYFHSRFLHIQYFFKMPSFIETIILVVPLFARAPFFSYVSVLTRSWVILKTSYKCTSSCSCCCSYFICYLCEMFDISIFILNRRLNILS